MKIDVKNFYSPQKMLSYNQFINMILGARGIGKTFSMKKYLLKKCIKNKTNFIYLRRYDVEITDELDKERFFTIDLLKNTFKDFNLIEQINNKLSTIYYFTSTENFKHFKTNKYNDINCHELKITSKKIFLDNNIICYFKSLNSFKGSEYDDTYDILFDEVLLDENIRRTYLKNEVEILIQALSSIFRHKEKCHVYMLSNSCNLNNPYFAYLKFDKLPEESYITNLKEYSFLIEYPETKIYENLKTKEDVRNNGLYNFSRHSKVFDSNVHNKFQVTNLKNIGKLEGEKHTLYNLCDNGFYIQVLRDKTLNILYIKKGCDMTKNTYTTNKNDIENNCIYLTRSDELASSLKACYYKNLIWYANSETKFTFLGMIQSLI